jgi:hypothetical protein
MDSNAADRPFMMVKAVFQEPVEYLQMTKISSFMADI